MNGNKRKHVPMLLDMEIFNSFLIRKLIKNLTKDGKQSAANKIVKQSFKKLKLQTKKNPSTLVCQSVYKQKLPIELMSVKKSGRVYKLPTVVNINRQFQTVLKLFSEVSKENKRTSTPEILVKEVLDSLVPKKKTLVQKKLENTCRIAIDNQPFMHFRWSSKRKKRIKKRRKKKQIQL